jgi:hypothetical protein
MVSGDGFIGYERSSTGLNRIHNRYTHLHRRGFNGIGMHEFVDGNGNRELQSNGIDHADRATDLMRRSDADPDGKWGEHLYLVARNGFIGHERSSTGLNRIHNRYTHLHRRGFNGIGMHEFVDGYSNGEYRSKLIDHATRATDLVCRTDTDPDGEWGEYLHLVSSNGFVGYECGGTDTHSGDPWFKDLYSNSSQCDWLYKFCNGSRDCQCFTERDDQPSRFCCRMPEPKLNA